ncbi:MAG: hypothetical protein Q8Q63_03305 [Phaeovulum sp.]|uniref:hypothetical protein n=1 Tax=Phaeovulum sp. TaxID=2934796 RepID=UPI002735A9DE|nr:hypothetical protein [Phaeovulum sp.]MDP3860592.1 hypothetical protein [Phaeovulum sp.]
MTINLRAALAAKAITASAALMLATAGFAAALTETAAPVAKTAPRGAIVAFDWRAGKSGSRKTSAVPVSARVSSGLSLGGGSYVCSPAGFGRQSSCFSR